MKGRFVAAVALSLALAPACKMHEQKPNPNLNKAPIVETIRDAGVRMADEGKDKLKELVPAKAQPEQRAAEPDAGTVKKNAFVHNKGGAQDSRLDEAIKKIDWSKVKLGPPSKSMGRDPEEIEKAEKAKSTQ